MYDNLYDMPNNENGNTKATVSLISVDSADLKEN